MFIDFSPEKKSHMKTENLKSLKTRNKSPVHYKYTWQRCASQSCLFTEGHGRQGGLAGAAQRLRPSTTQFVQHRARPPAMPRHAPGSSCNITSTHSLQDNGWHVVSVKSTYWSVSNWELAQDIANGSLWADLWMHQEPRWDLHTRIGLQDWATRESAALFMDFIFFLMQLFHLFSSYGRTDATSDFCLVWLQWHP